MAKIAAVCIGTAGGAAACVAGGVVPLPGLGEEPEQPRVERLADAPVSAPTPQVDYEPAEPKPKQAQPKQQRQPSHRQEPVETELASSQPAPVESTPVEATPVAEPAPEPVPAAAESGGGSPAGEFGP